MSSTPLQRLMVEFGNALEADVIQLIYNEAGDESAAHQSLCTLAMASEEARTRSPEDVNSLAVVACSILDSEPGENKEPEHQQPPTAWPSQEVMIENMLEDVLDGCDPLHPKSGMLCSVPLPAAPSGPSTSHEDPSSFVQNEGTSDNILADDGDSSRIPARDEAALGDISKFHGNSPVTLAASASDCNLSEESETKVEITDAMVVSYISRLASNPPTTSLTRTCDGNSWEIQETREDIAEEVTLSGASRSFATCLAPVARNKEELALESDLARIFEAPSHDGGLRRDSRDHHSLHWFSNLGRRGSDESNRSSSSGDIGTDRSTDSHQSDLQSSSGNEHSTSAHHPQTTSVEETSGTQTAGSTGTAALESVPIPTSTETNGGTAKPLPPHKLSPDAVPFVPRNLLKPSPLLQNCGGGSESHSPSSISALDRLDNARGASCPPRGVITVPSVVKSAVGNRTERSSSASPFQRQSYENMPNQSRFRSSSREVYSTRKEQDRRVSTQSFSSTSRTVLSQRRGHSLGASDSFNGPSGEHQASHGWTAVRPLAPTGPTFAECVQREGLDKAPIGRPIRGANKRTDPNADFQKIMGVIRQGIKRVMVILRGLPGSGKSTLAEKLKANGRVYSTDDYFMQNGQYVYDPFSLEKAHSTNQQKVRHDMCHNGITPVIVDNTNTKLWEMVPYARMSMQCDYELYILELPKISSRELEKRNIHNVPFSKLKEMELRYEHGITAEVLIKQVRFQSGLDRTSKPEGYFSGRKTWTRNSSSGASGNVRENHSRSDTEKRANVSETDGASTFWTVDSSVGSEGPKPQRAVKEAAKANPLPLCSQAKESEKREVADHDFLLPLSSTPTRAENSPPADDHFAKGFNCVRSKSSSPPTERANLVENDNMDSLTSFQRELPKPQRSAAESFKPLETGDKSSIYGSAPSGLGGMKSRKPKSGPRLLDVELSESLQQSKSWTNLSGIHDVSAHERANAVALRPVEYGASTALGRPKPIRNQGSMVELKDLEIVAAVGKNTPFAEIPDGSRYILRIGSTSRKMCVENVGTETITSTTHERNVMVISVRLDKSTMTDDHSDWLGYMMTIYSAPREVVEDLFRWHGSDYTAILLHLDEYSSKTEFECGEELDETDTSETFAAEPSLPSPSVQTGGQASQEAEEFALGQQVLSDLGQDGAEAAIRFEDGNDVTFHIKKSILAGLPSEPSSLSETPSLGSLPQDVEDQQSASSHREEVGKEEKALFDDSEIIYINFPRSVIEQLQSAVGSEPGVAAEGGDVLAPITKSMAQRLLHCCTKGLATSPKPEEHLQILSDEALAKAMQEEEEKMHQMDQTSVPARNLRDIMEEETKAAASEQKQKMLMQKKMEQNSSIAMEFTKKFLYESFPGLEKSILESMFMEHGFQLEATVEAIEKQMGISSVPVSRNGPLAGPQLEVALSEGNGHNDSDESHVRSEENYRRIRSKVLKLVVERKRIMDEAVRHLSRGTTYVYQHYSPLLSEYTARIKKANSEACRQFADMCWVRVQKQSMLDLHGFHVKEAISVLTSTITRCKRALAQFGSKFAHDKLVIITGRGLHSGGGPKIKPAVLAHLKTMDYRFTEVNDGAFCLYFQQK